MRTAVRDDHRVLLKDTKYRRQYVALKSFDKAGVVAYGTDPLKVYRAAVRKGCREPVMVYVPDKDSVQIYPVSTRSR